MLGRAGPPGPIARHSGRSRIMVSRLIAVAGLAAALGAGGCADMAQRHAEEAETTGLEAAAMRYQQRLNRDGTMPENALWKAKLRRDQMAAGLPASPLDTSW